MQSTQSEIVNLACHGLIQAMESETCSLGCDVTETQDEEQESEVEELEREVGEQEREVESWSEFS